MFCLSRASPYTKIYSKWVKDHQKLQVFGTGDDFSDKPPKAQVTKAKTYKRDNIKLKISSQKRKQQSEEQSVEWEIVFANYFT